jgi:hypothetical protein
VKDKVSRPYKKQAVLWHQFDDIISITIIIIHITISTIMSLYIPAIMISILAKPISNSIILAKHPVLNSTGLQDILTEVSSGFPQLIHSNTVAP